MEQIANISSSSTVSDLAKKGNIQGLMTLLKDPNQSLGLREEAAGALAKQPAGVDLDFVLRFVKKVLVPGDEQYRLRCILITLIGEVGDFRTTKTLIRLLNNKNEDFRIRYTAAHAIGRLGDDSAIGSLISILEDPRDTEIKSSIVAALLALDEAKIALPVIKYMKSRLKDEFKLMSPDNY
ncbi:hypothetical protein DGWBC_0435 [Dehalogenimonas sp. WBC-2]|nr:hypothetical protein DGWBC_0435 [Dehalogenimonas sp. WBC-2]